MCVPPLGSMAQRRGPGGGSALVLPHERQDELLRRDADKFGPRVDSRQVGSCPQLPHIGKQDHARKQQAVEAAMADKMMILNIAKEMRRPNSLSCLQQKGPTSLNLDRRRRE